MNKFPISPLFIPANKTDWIAKTFEKGADSIILDLEDSVPHNEKSTARENLYSHLKENSYSGNLIVRVNPINEKSEQAFKDRVESIISRSDLPNPNIF